MQSGLCIFTNEWICLKFTCTNTFRNTTNQISSFQLPAQTDCRSLPFDLQLRQTFFNIKNRAHKYKINMFLSHIVYMGLVARKPNFWVLRTTKAQTSLRIRAV